MYEIYFVRLKFLFIINYIISNMISADGILNFKFVSHRYEFGKNKKKKGKRKNYSLNYTFQFNLYPFKNVSNFVAIIIESYYIRKVDE